MGKNTEAKLKKVLSQQELQKARDKKDNKKKLEKPKKKTTKIVTEESQSKKSIIILSVLAVVLAGIGIYLKFFAPQETKTVTKSIKGLFEKPRPRNDGMLEPTKLTKEQLREYSWVDNPFLLAKQFEIISFFRGNFPKVRIKINAKEYADKKIPLRNVGELLTEDYLIIDIQDPVVFLSDKKGKIHRLVDPMNWNNAASFYGWKKNIFGDPNEVKTDESDGMTPEEEAITFGDFELVNATESQVSQLRAWTVSNPDYKFEDFERKCSELGLAYKLKLSSTMGGILKPNTPEGE